jgi:MFS transporter, ACS family, glucarate transporter
MSTSAEKPTNVRYGVLGFACVLSMITYLDRVCFGTIAPYVESEFHLDKDQMAWIFGAFTLAYAAFEVPTGWLGDVFGPRKTLIRIVLWWSVFTALTGLIYPSLGTSLAFWAMLSVRFLFGIGEAGAYPNIARAFHNWFPFQERGFAKGAVWMAGRFGGGITPFIVLALVYEVQLPEAVNPPIVQEHWRHIFWIFGAIGVLWCVAFYFWFRDLPDEHPSANQAEVDLIKGTHPLATMSPPVVSEAIQAHSPTLPPSTAIAEGEPKLPSPAAHGERIRVPWGKLLTSPNLWLICGMYFCASYGWYFNITYLPGFIRSRMEVGDKWTPSWWQYSLMAGLPLLLGSVACIVGGYLTDLFIKKTANRKWGRRLFGILGHGLCAGFYFLSISFMGLSDPWPFVVCIAVATFWNDITMGAAWASCIDIGRRYSGIVSGCMNTIGNLGGFTANLSTGYILKYYTSGIDKAVSEEAYNQAMAAGWETNVLVFSGAYVVAVFFWMLFDATKPIDKEEGA